MGLEGSKPVLQTGKKSDLQGSPFGLKNEGGGLNWNSVQIMIQLIKKLISLHYFSTSINRPKCLGTGLAFHGTLLQRFGRRQQTYRFSESEVIKFYNKILHALKM